MIKKEQGLLDFSLPAVELERKIRAYNPWPGAFTYWNDQILKIYHSHIAHEACGLPGRRIIIQGSPAFCTIQGSLV
jgi:methionyl-tRNA formyltransferase